MQSDQRRRTRRVDRHTRPAQIEQIGQTVGRDAERISGSRIRIHRVQVVDETIAVVWAGHANVDRTIAAFHVARTHARILEGLPREFEQQALLRVHLLRFARRDAEEGRVETRDVVEHAG